MAVLSILPIRGIVLKKKPSGLRPIGVPLLILDGVITKAVSLKKKDEFQVKVRRECEIQLALEPL